MKKILIGIIACLAIWFILMQVKLSMKSSELKSISKQLRPKAEEFLALYKAGDVESIHASFSDTNTIKFSDIMESFGEANRKFGEIEGYKYRGYSATSDKKDGIYEINLMYNIEFKGDKNNSGVFWFPLTKAEIQSKKLTGEKQFAVFELLGEDDSRFARIRLVSHP